MKKALLLLFSSIIIVQCNDIDSCESDTNRSAMIVRFFDFETKEAKKVGFEITGTGSIFLFGLSDDSLAVGLPLDPATEDVAFTFESDTSDFMLHVSYDHEFSIFDPACEPSILFTGIDTLSSDFDSTAIIGRVTDVQLTTNIEVYF